MIAMVKFDVARQSFWQRVFLQSKVNGAPYLGDQLPGSRWQWPKNTYLQRRLRYVRPFIGTDKRGLN
jgi:hypothetical protein